MVDEARRCDCRRSQVRHAAPAARRQEGACARCREPVWLSKGSMERVKRGDVANCSPCVAFAILRSDELPTLEFPTVQELADAWSEPN